MLTGGFGQRAEWGNMIGHEVVDRTALHTDRTPAAGAFGSQNTDQVVV